LGGDGVEQGGFDVQAFQFGAEQGAVKQEALLKAAAVLANAAQEFDGRIGGKPSQKLAAPLHGFAEGRQIFDIERLEIGGVFTR
jgi:hypothetical protein